jgi:hypothetical protein
MSMFQNVIFSSTEEWGTYMFSFGGTTFHSELYPAQKVGPPACMGLPRLLFWGGGGVKALGAGHCLTHQSSEYNEVMQ